MKNKSRATGIIALLTIAAGAAWYGWSKWKYPQVDIWHPAGTVPPAIPKYPQVDIWHPIEPLKLGTEVKAENGKIKITEIVPVVLPDTSLPPVSTPTPIEILASSGKSVEETKKILSGYGSADDPVVKAMMAAQQLAMFASAGVQNYAQWAAAVSAEMSRAAGRPM